MEMTFIFFSVIIILASYMLSREIHHLREHFKDENAKLEKRIADLEQANPLRIPHKAADNVLDVIALVSDALEHEQDISLFENQRRSRERQKLEDALCRLRETLKVGTKREEK